ncbi:hypothetical protein KUCAC02_023754 [Chaenocephalus aceratus]|uniref:Uncharacterized protein n=1 Tax=Chaenocephalus aceratus TaxID=36190 RepID=A0ACB9WGP9_CHAAC|nr:hypothetical protein KUCAC02_023754 [Chaenocephalus aceratus]
MDTFFALLLLLREMNLKLLPLPAVFHPRARQQPRPPSLFPFLSFGCSDNRDDKAAASCSSREPGLTLDQPHPSPSGSLPATPQAKRLSALLQLSITDPGTVWLHQRSHAHRLWKQSGPCVRGLEVWHSLAQKAKRPSGSESPQRNSTSDLDNVPEEVVAHSSRQELSRKHSDDVFTVIENGNEHYLQPERSPDDLPLEQIHLQQDVLKLNTYVALFSFTPQDSHDLEMRLVY